MDLGQPAWRCVQHRIREWGRFRSGWNCIKGLIAGHWWVGFVGIGMVGQRAASSRSHRLEAAIVISNGPNFGHFRVFDHRLTRGRIAQVQRVWAYNFERIERLQSHRLDQLILNRGIQVVFRSLVWSARLNVKSWSPINSHHLIVIRLLIDFRFQRLLQTVQCRVLKRHAIGIFVERPKRKSEPPGILGKYWLGRTFYGVTLFWERYSSRFKGGLKHRSTVISVEGGWKTTLKNHANNRQMNLEYLQLIKRLVRQLASKR